MSPELTLKESVVYKTVDNVESFALESWFLSVLGYVSICEENPV